jgi:hypothetical protein
MAWRSHACHPKKGKQLPAVLLSLIPLPGGGVPSQADVLRACWTGGLLQRKQQAKSLWSHGKKVGLVVKHPAGGGAISFYWKREIATVTGNTRAVQDFIVEATKHFTKDRHGDHDHIDLDAEFDPASFEWMDM